MPYIIIVLSLWKTLAISILPVARSGHGSAERRTVYESTTASGHIILHLNA